MVIFHGVRLPQLFSEYLKSLQISSNRFRYSQTFLRYPELAFVEHLAQWLRTPHSCWISPRNPTPFIPLQGRMSTADLPHPGQSPHGLPFVPTKAQVWGHLRMPVYGGEYAVLKRNKDNSFPSVHSFVSGFFRRA